MEEVRRQDIDYHTSELDIHNHNPVEGFIRFVRQKWYQTVVKKRVTRQLWYYGVSWVPEVIPMTHFSANSVNGGISLKT